MKVTVFNGSPAGENSVTNVIAAAFLQGAKEAGAETENIFLKDYQIAHCQGCFSCWFKTPGQCIIHDDMELLMKIYQESDIVCYGTPVYTWNMTAMLKNFVDRLIPLKSPKIIESQGKFDLEDSEAKTQRFVVIANCGFPGENNFDVLRTSVAACNPFLEIYRNCGKLLKSKDPKIEEIVARWLQSVKQAGKETVILGNVSADTEEALRAPLMSVRDYVSWLGMG